MDRRLTVPPSVLVAGRVVGAGLLATTAVIHLYLWDTGYRAIPWIGPLFLVQAATGLLLCVAVLAVSQGWLSEVALLGVLLQIGTLVGLLMSVEVGLFGFHESPVAALFGPSVGAEVVGTLVLAALAAVRPREQRPRQPAATREVRAGR
ncbi:hypothetical protein GCU56_14030 [Geodermatophilus sabuli]|uniref:Uncharacterized protein n=1 Tax=Geodermatophilus sabuli TaxID=1564158 RepID=A0A7K3W283_9ACTN|nr:hypothetical protein [Geodermatophilus sabuli]NEK58986.1 hypothetical protein [Geodermatophilus sabuli]